MQQAIIYCRVSTMSDKQTKSLDSQEYELLKYMNTNRIRPYKTLKTIGSAYNKAQVDLYRVLESCKNRELLVWSADRLSRNTNNFLTIWNLCAKNNHSIHIVNEGHIYTPHKDTENDQYSSLLSKITIAQQYSIDLGKHVSRAHQYRKSREAPWGYEFENGELFECDRERLTTKLIILLRTPGSSINVIRQYIEHLSSVSIPFEIVEYDRTSSIEITDKLPYEMSFKAICDTLRLYEIKHRNRYFRNSDINEIAPVIEASSDTSEVLKEVNEIENRLENLEINQSTAPWNCIFFDPKFGLPPNITLPSGMKLPNETCMLYVPNM